MSSTEGSISTRVREVIETKTGEKGRVKELERLTGIPASSWKNFLNGQQKATISMVEKLSQTFPDTAFWIATGISDDRHGHVTPKWHSTFHNAGSTNSCTVKYFQEELARTRGNLAQVEHGLSLLEKLELIPPRASEPALRTDRSAFLKRVRWLHIFLDEYLPALSADTAISAFNEMRGEAQEMKEKAIELNENDLFMELINHFAEKRNEVEEWVSKLNKEIEDRAKRQMSTPSQDGNSEK